MKKKDSVKPPKTIRLNYSNAGDRLYFVMFTLFTLFSCLEIFIFYMKKVWIFVFVLNAEKYVM